MNLRELELCLESSWGRDTCYSSMREGWSRDNPANGQCTATSLVVKDYFGGDIIFCFAITPNGGREPHFFNRLKDGDVDLTRRQFPDGTVFVEERVMEKEHILSMPNGVTDRYTILKERTQQALSVC